MFGLFFHQINQPYSRLSSYFPSYVTDNYTVAVELFKNAPKVSKSTNLFFKKTDSNAVQNKVAAQNWDHVTNINCVEDCFTALFLVDTVHDIFHEGSTLVKFNSKRNNLKPWITPSLINLL